MEGTTIEAAVRDHAVDVGAEVDEQLHPLRPPRLGGAMQPSDATFVTWQVTLPLV